ncbi:MAG: ABC transporter ATP-binding protein/permease [Treponema sp.]|jgi:ATP-binding cassette subfamily B protein/ATP-binding cassette subfamily C protein|nr:ABC transporter ATP-binding protein/permease [Treponema sp.]
MKKGNRKKSLFIGIGFLLKLYWRYGKSSLVCMLLYCVLQGLVPFASIMFPKFIIDELTGAQQLSSLVFYTGCLILCVLLGNTLVNFFHIKYFINGTTVFNKFTVDLSRNLYEADLERIESASFLDLKGKADRFLYGDGSGWGGVLSRVATVSSNVITLAGIVTIIAVLNPLVVVVFTGLTFITAWFNSRIKKLNNQLAIEQPVQERRLSYDMDLFHEHRFAKEIRINTLGPWLLERLRGRLAILQNFYATRHSNNLKAQVFSNVITFIQQGLAYGYLIYLILNGRFGIGSFTMYLAAINGFSGAMFSLMDSVVDIRRFSDYYDAVDDYLNIPRKQREGKQPLNLSVSPVLEFRDVSFRYPGQNGYALRHINLTITDGEKLSVVGENGAGKTTFTKLLMRLYRPTEGQILLNGRDIQEFDFESYENMLSVVFQDFALFSMTLRENVALGRTVDDSRVIEALRKSGFGEKLDSLENGLDTPLYKMFDENGIEPSGGEGQKIAIARALLRDAPVVVLDEPTAALDPRAEYEIYLNFNEMVKGKTAVFISHRLSSARFCDKVAVFKQGEVAEYGSHDELIQKRGLYHELFTMQAQFYEGETGD